tara:strand:- start:70 stop:522 length:453 start_codon:yes stop_codon:yes gene_type:complete
MEKIRLYTILILLSLVFPIKENQYEIPSGEEYIIGEDGIKRIYINIWGHVKHPGTYLVFENIDIATLLSMAGGPLDGANLKDIEIISQYDNNIESIDFFKTLSYEKKDQVQFGPYDTIRIRPTTSYYLTENAYLVNVLLQLITLGVTLNN